MLNCFRTQPSPKAIPYNSLIQQNKHEFKDEMLLGSLQE